MALPSGQRREPGLEHESTAEAVADAAPGHPIYPTPLPFALAAVPDGQLPNPLGREADPIATTKHLELARLLEAPERLQGHPTRLVPLQRVQVQPQDQDRRARRVQRKRRL